MTEEQKGEGLEDEKRKSTRFSFPSKKLLKKKKMTPEEESEAEMNNEIDILDQLMSVNLSSDAQNPGKDDTVLPKYMIMESDRMAWDITLSVIILFYTMVVPLRLAFEGTVNEPYATPSEYDFIMTPHSPMGFWFIFDNAMDIIFLCDICLNFRTAYEENGFLVKDYKQIGIEYLKSWFVLDLVASFPLGTCFILAGSTGGSFSKVNKMIRILRFVKVSKLLRILKMGRIFRRVQMYAGLNPGVLRLGRSCVILLVLWHYIACIYWMISRMEGFCDWSKPGGKYNPSSYDDAFWDTVDDDMTTQQRKDFWKWGSTTDNPNGFNECTGDWVPWRHTKMQSLQTQYSQAVFWSVMITTGVGYDIAPETNIEVFFTIVCILIGILMNAVVIGSITSAIESFDASQAEKREKLENVNEFLRKNNIPLRLRFEINDYYEYLFDAGLDAAAMVKELPIILQMKLEVALKKRKIMTCTLFRGVKAEVLLILIQNLESDVKLPTEYLFRSGDESHQMFMIENGQVNLLMVNLKPEDRWRKLYDGLMKEHQESSSLHAIVVDKQQRDPWSTSILIAEKQDEVQVDVVKKFGYFGEQALIGMPQLVSARTKNYCELLILDCDPKKTVDNQRNPLASVATDYPQFFRKIQKAINTRAKQWEESMHKLSKKPGKESGRDQEVENIKMTNSDSSVDYEPTGDGLEMNDFQNSEKDHKEDIDSDASDSEMSTGSENSDDRHGNASDWFNR